MSEPAAIPRGSSKHLALVSLLLIVPAPTVGVLAAMYLWPGTWAGKAIFAAAKAWMLLLPLVWVRFVERGRFTLSPARRGGFGPAIVLGLVMSGVILLAFKIAGNDMLDPEHVRSVAIENGIGTPAMFLSAAAFWILVNSVLEEYVYRWFIFRQSEAIMPGAAAVVVSAGTFTIHHVLALKDQFDWTPTVLASAGIFIGGAVWSVLYRKYRSIWPGYVSHAIVDVAVFTLGWTLIFGQS